MRRSVVLAGIAVVAIMGLALWAQQPQAFPHRAHARLFPLCEGCHEMSGGRETYYPPAELCARCHDGEQATRVTWASPAPRPTNLVFNHAQHERELARRSQSLACADCHTPADSARMTVTEAAPPTCLSCHAHQATNHLEDARCADCHVPLARSSLTPEHVAFLPAPPDHFRKDFLLQHGAEADGGDCQFCHVREHCSDCHVNAQTEPAIRQLASAPALGVEPIPARYPTPASHTRPDFAMNHAEIARTESCAACHTRESCTTCHADRAPEAVLALTPASASRAQGVTTESRLPVSHAAPSFAINHGTDAATHPDGCASCHATSFCESCHEAPDRARFHPDDFMLGHSSAAYSSRLECSNCHDQRVFCRECHANTGQTSSGRLTSPVFHDAEPLWLLRHGGAARRGLESCASCHAQRDCLQCHSTLGAFRISPHTSDFDARRAQQRNPVICRACHIGDPIR